MEAVQLHEFSFSRKFSERFNIDLSLKYRRQNFLAITFKSSAIEGTHYG